MGISIIKGELIQSSADAIVHIISHSPLSGGADSKLYQAAGPELYQACTTLGVCMTGEAKITSGYRLPAKYVIHTHAPIWLGGNHNEGKLTEACYRNCLTLAEKNGCTSIAFPPISTGSYRCPAGKAADIAIGVIEEFLKSSRCVKEVFIISSEDSICSAFSDSLEAHRKQTH